MTKEEISKEIAQEIWKNKVMTKRDIELTILKKLKEILHQDKGRLTKGTIVL